MSHRTSKQMAQYRAEATRLLASDYYDPSELLADLLAAQAENAAMREIVEQVADGKTIYYASHEGTFCTLCNRYVPGNVNVPEYPLALPILHTPECPVTKARALVAQWKDAPTNADR